MEYEQDGKGGDHRIGEPGCQAIQAGDKRPAFSVRQFAGKALFDQMKHFRTPNARTGRAAGARMCDIIAQVKRNYRTPFLTGGLARQGFRRRSGSYLGQ